MDELVVVLRVLLMNLSLFAQLILNNMTSLIEEMRETGGLGSSVEGIAAARQYGNVFLDDLMSR